EEQVQYEYELRNFIAYDGGLFLAEENGFKKGEAKGREEGRVEGEAKGKAEERLALALKFKELGTDVSIIQQATGLTLEEINNL
ncbi:MAG: hypothetical protein MJZ83_04560, partial [Bacteroidaceae bacterium]|nr:hypothetical protein [Bacteroidaceae bacterium]